MGDRGKYDEKAQLPGRLYSQINTSLFHNYHKRGTDGAHEHQPVLLLSQATVTMSSPPSKAIVPLFLVLFSQTSSVPHAPSASKLAPPRSLPSQAPRVPAGDSSRGSCSRPAPPRATAPPLPPSSPSRPRLPFRRSRRPQPPPTWLSTTLLVWLWWWWWWWWWRWWVLPSRLFCWGCRVAA